MKTELPSTNLYDWKTDKTCETTKVVDVSKDVGIPKGDDPLFLLYTEDRNGEIVQLRHGCSSLHYHTASISREDHVDSALSNMAHWCGTTKKKLIELCLKHSPTVKHMKPTRATSLKVVQTPLPLTGESTTFNPLATQVGGQHYKDMPIQPVEFSERNQLPYCMANVIKYVSRHKMKHGREDLEKAVHYCDLGLSMYEQTKTAWRTQDSDWAITPLRFCQENGFDVPTTKAVIHLCSVFSRGSTGYLEAKAVLEKILETDYAPLKASWRATRK